MTPRGRPAGSALAAVVASALALGLAGAACAHDVERAAALLGEIAAHRSAAATAPDDDARAEAAFGLGEAAVALVDELNRDVVAHGRRELFAELVVRRLRSHGLEVTWSQEAFRYAYDMAAFRDALRLAPRGRWAAEAAFRLIAQRFYATLGTDPAALVDTDVAALLQAVADGERFLREHGGHARAGTVRFFLAVDHFRIARNVADPARREAHAERARTALRQTVQRSTEPFEVRAAQTLLERLDAWSRAR